MVPYDRARLEVGRRFLVLRPRIVLVGGVVNALLLARADVGDDQRTIIASTFAGALVAFFGEAWFLARRPLTDRWLVLSLSLTLVALGIGSLFSGGSASPLFPILFAPVVVGLAAFGRRRESGWLLGFAAAVVALLALVAPTIGAAPVPAPWGPRMIAASAVTTLVLAGVGVVGLVDAHVRAATVLSRLREDALVRVETEQGSIERLGARVAHEVKNPLTAVRALVQLLQRGERPEKDRERLSVVEREVDRALGVLEGYLRAATPPSEIARRPTPAAEILRDVTDLVIARADEKGVAVTTESDATVLDVDAARIRDAVLNLVLNALHATPAGGAIRLRAAHAGERHVVEVADTGRGLDPSTLARLSSGANVPSADGHGLGVAIARGIVERHGGTLTFESTVGHGTTARMEIPAWPRS